MVQNCDFNVFKANIRGVDLNNNFDAKFGTDPRYAKAPSAHGYNGVVPESEPESKLLAELARFLNPDFTISFHRVKKFIIIFTLMVGVKNTIKNRPNILVSLRAINWLTIRAFRQAGLKIIALKNWASRQ